MLYNVYGYYRENLYVDPALVGELLHSVGGARFLRRKEIGFNYDKKMGFGAMRNNFRLHENSFKGKSENI